MVKPGRGQAGPCARLGTVFVYHATERAERVPRTLWYTRVSSNPAWKQAFMSRHTWAALPRMDGSQRVYSTTTCALFI